MKEKNKSEDGAIIVEASICLPFFIFVIVMFLSLIDICMTQAKIATALNIAAKEISEYSYLYVLTGANDVQNDLYQAGDSSRTTINNTLDGLNTMTETLVDDKNAIMNEDIDVNKLADDLESVGSNANDLYKEWGEQLSDPKKFIKSLACLVGNEALEGTKSYLLGEVLGKAFMVKNLQMDDSEGSNYEAAEKFLRANHIKPEGDSYLGGLDFDKTKVFANGQTERIQLVVTYKIHVVKLLNIDFDFTIQQCAITKAWGSGIDASES